MIKDFSQLRSLVLPLLLIFSFAFTNFAQAQDSAGVGITPAVIDPAELFDPGSAAQFNFKVSNLSGEDQTYFLSTRDIVGVRDEGVPVFADKNSPATGFELSSWITLPESEVFVPAGGEKEMSFLVNIPNEATPGSHFGSIIISVEPPELRSSGAGIGYEVANIINLRVTGDVVDQARLRQFSTNKYIYGSINVEFSARVENEGNTLVKPIGPLEVYNMFGKKVANLNFNETKAGVFPKTPMSNGLRDYKLVWQDETPGFGRYEAILSLAYGSEGKIQTISSTVTFWVLPSNIVVPALITLAVLLLVVYVSVKIYVRRSVAIANSGATRRLVRTRRTGSFPTLLVVIAMLALSALLFIILLLMFA
jgi:hypothetical protein